ncbi:amino acid ABC transporter membrane protein 2 (PAAT family) [Chromohalobacter marismortui]|uniref:Amino acid ABC transporter membrane protein 2 (PAAT family) n=1 Tax=Chromohalobacter marismortui TaxID=42055 RepID=A0A4R7NMJ8_9GAMM|nr:MULTISPECIES: amino acid ABC transporter permease [Chromohalobacter]MCI0509832.1 amino acid ABC transporter permease [Chromohalobacter sp.]MCI0591838.1 amino acid ABC transporter permease [Chromohalobacter sp.]TDU22054.1 amino acid ABC transporter membrane protein 2 (PAAT family) [Chromohalobacter marismortui]
MSNWEILWQARDEFLIGFWRTLEIFGLSIAGAFLIGCGLLYLLEGSRKRLTMPLRIFIDAMRMLPFLILVYLLYYGLPSVGIRLDAWWTGVGALAVYHGTYFAEIFRSNRLTFPPGQIEAAKAHGFTKSKMFFRLILPQVIMQTRPLLGNQLIYALKDTAFLVIITVRELTAVANSLSSTYFIPTEAFIVVIGFYWALSVAMEIIIKQCGRFSAKRGFDNV